MTQCDVMNSFPELNETGDGEICVFEEDDGGLETRLEEAGVLVVQISAPLVVNTFDFMTGVYNGWFERDGVCPDERQREAGTHRAWWSTEHFRWWQSCCVQALENYKLSCFSRHFLFRKVSSFVPKLFPFHARHRPREEPRGRRKSAIFFLKILFIIIHRSTSQLTITLLNFRYKLN